MCMLRSGQPVGGHSFYHVCPGFEPFSSESSLQAPVMFVKSVFFTQFLRVLLAPASSWSVFGEKCRVDHVTSSPEDCFLVLPTHPCFRFSYCYLLFTYLKHLKKSI